MSLCLQLILRNVVETAVDTYLGEKDSLRESLSFRQCARKLIERATGKKSHFHLSFIKSISLPPPPSRPASSRPVHWPHSTQRKRNIFEGNNRRRWHERSSFFRCKVCPLSPTPPSPPLSLSYLLIIKFLKKRIFSCFCWNWNQHVAQGSSIRRNLTLILTHMVQNGRGMAIAGKKTCCTTNNLPHIRGPTKLNGNKSWKK